MSGLQQKLQSVDELGPAEAQAQLRDIIVGDYPNDVESVKSKEQALSKLADLLVKQQDATALAGLLTDLRPLFNAIPKAKTAKIVRTVIDSIAKVPNSTQLQVRSAKQQRCVLAGPPRRPGGRARVGAGLEPRI
jgi:26S proteasome regulatory subunit N6